MGSKCKATAPARANTGSSIRGKISAPIPIPDDEEFPIRSPGTGIATPLGTEGIEKQLRAGIALSDYKGEARVQSTTRSYNEGPAAMPRPRQTIPTPLRYSEIGQEESSIEKTPQRKKTTLKSVLGRIFGAKKGRFGASARSSTQNAIARARADQHRSDPIALNRDMSTSETLSQKRSASLPINEYNRALRSHSPFTETFPLLKRLDDAKRTSATLAERRARTRRATTPRRQYDSAPPGRLDNGLAPRPASSHARDSKLFADDECRSGIGCAVTSGSHPNRRSRSLDGLKQAAEAQAQSHTRRRSDEIRYWRQSYDIDAMSPMSSPKIEKGFPDLAHHGGLERGVRSEAESLVPPQPFNFGPMGEMAGMKITEAASLETRVKRMEKKLQQMEKMMLHFQSASALSGPTDPAAQKHRSINQAAGTRLAGDESSSVYSMPGHVDRLQAAREADQHNSRPTTCDTQLSLADVSSTTTNNNRPLSTSTTIRGVSSDNKKGSQLTGERYTNLVSFITSEKQARLRLETIVDRLSSQLQDQIRVQSESRPSSLNTYHQPIHVNPHILNPTSAARAASSENPYSSPSSDYRPFPSHINVPRGGGTASKSTFEAEDDEDSDTSDDGKGTGSTNEAFQTPNEEREHYDMQNPDEDFGGNDDGRDGKRAVRITSLSQLTLGKGRAGGSLQQAINF